MKRTPSSQDLIRRVLLIALGVLVAPRLGLAESITHESTIEIASLAPLPGQPYDTNSEFRIDRAGTISIPAFDPALGTLEDHDLSISVVEPVIGVYLDTADGSRPAETVYTYGDVFIANPFGSGNRWYQARTDIHYLPGSAAGAIHYDPTPSVHIFLSSYSGWSPNPSTSDFIGTQPISFPISTRAGAKRNQFGQDPNGAIDERILSIEITYTYTPAAPAVPSLPTVGLGILAMASVAAALRTLRSRALGRS